MRRQLLRLGYSSASYRSVTTNARSAAGEKTLSGSWLKPDLRWYNCTNVRRVPGRSRQFSQTKASKDDSTPAPDANAPEANTKPTECASITPPSNPSNSGDNSGKGQPGDSGAAASEGGVNAAQHGNEPRKEAATYLLASMPSIPMETEGDPSEHGPAASALFASGIRMTTAKDNPPQGSPDPTKVDDGSTRPGEDGTSEARRLQRLNASVAEEELRKLEQEKEEAKAELEKIRPFNPQSQAMKLNLTYQPLMSRKQGVESSQSNGQGPASQTSSTQSGQGRDRGKDGADTSLSPDQELLIRKLTRPNEYSLDNSIDFRNLYKFYTSVLPPHEAQAAIELVLSDPEREICRKREKQNEDSEVLEDKLNEHGVYTLWRLLRDEDSTNEHIWVAYRELEPPGVKLLGEHSRGLLLHRFAKPRRRTRADCLRYLALVDDMTEAGLYLSNSLWHAAIHLAGKHSFNITTKDLREALGMWRRMEYQGGHTSSKVTFNILFDIAIKAGQFRVAERIVQEMDSRGLTFSRFGKVERIFLQGLLGNANGVREEYNEFVRSGELVDTVVLNCVMVSLIRSGQYPLAEEVYERMKGIYEHFKKQGDEPNGEVKVYPSPSDNYTAYRAYSGRLGFILNASSILKERRPEAHNALQSALPLTPDARTFHILLYHHAIRTGDFKKFVSLLDDMKRTFEISPQGMIFVFLFQGFAIYGGRSNSEWSMRRLRKAWRSFLKALDEPRNVRGSKKRTRERLSSLTADLTEESGLLSETGQEMHAARAAARQITRDYEDRQAAEAREYEAALAKGETPPSELKLLPSEEDNARTQRNIRNRLILESAVDDEWRNENSVYLGRLIIISVLNAFKKCGTTDEIIDVWEAIEARWNMNEQRASDILAVRSELRRLLQGYVYRP